MVVDSSGGVQGVCIHPSSSQDKSDSTAHPLRRTQTHNHQNRREEMREVEVEEEDTGDGGQWERWPAYHRSTPYHGSFHVESMDFDAVQRIVQ